MRADREGAEMGRGSDTDAELAGLVERTSDAASALIRGDISRYLTLIRHADDYTLMAPFGGEPRRGFDASDRAVKALAEFFRGGGEADLQVVESYTSGDLVVLVAVERQHGEVGGLPDQDWSLRVTLVFRREGTGWRLAHRHADPLVHEMTLEQAASIAGGWPAVVDTG
jgi:ketosteroid isomerase-like protein